jgi:hypothetical protein
MTFPRHRSAIRRLIVILIAGGVLIIGSTTAANTTRMQGDSADKERPGPIHVAVSGASAGITTTYFESAVTDAIVASDVFTVIDSSEKTEVTMRMLRSSSTFSDTSTDIDAPYRLKIRIIKVETPSFSARMTVSMNAIWELYSTTENRPLLHEKIYSTYTGGVFEGGLHGANRVRVAMEGAARNNIDIGVEMLASLNLEQE